jgi:hypothetical protein
MDFASGPRREFLFQPTSLFFFFTKPSRARLGLADPGGGGRWWRPRWGRASKAGLGHMISSPKLGRLQPTTAGPWRQVAWWPERRRRQTAPGGSRLWLGFWGAGRGARGRPGGGAGGLLQWNAVGAELSSGAAMAVRALRSAHTAAARVANCSRAATAAAQQ